MSPPPPLHFIFFIFFFGSLSLSPFPPPPPLSLPPFFYSFFFFLAVGNGNESPDGSFVSDYPCEFFLFFLLWFHHLSLPISIFNFLPCALPPSSLHSQPPTLPHPPPPPPPPPFFFHSAPVGTFSRTAIAGCFHRFFLFFIFFFSFVISYLFL